MSIRGVRQLKELIIRYSDRDGSSEGIRHWMHQQLVNFAKTNPTLTVRTVLKRNKHPTLTGVYLNGNSKTICVRSEDTKEIDDRVLFLRNQCGRKLTTGYKKPWYSDKPSIQGEWHERMDVINLPLQIVHEESK